MTENPPPSDKRDFVFSPADIQRAAAEGVLSQNDADSLVRWGYEQHFNQLLVREPLNPPPEQRKGFNLVTVVYSTFMLFGAIGVYIYLGHLAFQVFKESMFFPFVLALLGLSMIMLTVWVQKRMIRASQPS